MKVLIAPDSFKGSMSAVEVCSIVSTALKDADPDCETDCIPVADGGEGTADSFAFACKAEMKQITVTGPDYRKIKAHFAVMGDTAVIETAQACGLPLAGNENNPMLATTLGVGELILAALNESCRKIILGIGGSATNDGGIGCLSMLGFDFYDKKRQKVTPDALGLSTVEHIDTIGADPRLEECEFTVLCDVENPLYGENGAAFVYAPQKGADSQAVTFLDNALRNYERAVLKSMKTDCANCAGSGAAGGMGYGFRVFLGAQLKSGAKTVLDICRFDERAEKADAIITGEGKFDSQSLMGKLPGEIISRANGKPIAVICGINTAQTSNESIAVFETNREHLPFEMILPECKEALYSAVFKDVSKFLKKIAKNA